MWRTATGVGFPGRTASSMGGVVGRSRPGPRAGPSPPNPRSGRSPGDGNVAPRGGRDKRNRVAIALRGTRPGARCGSAGCPRRLSRFAFGAAAPPPFRWTARRRRVHPGSGPGFQEAMGEAHVPAEQSEAQEEARVPAPDEEPRRSGRAEGAPPARPQAPLRLIWRVRDRGTFEALGQAPARVAGPVRVRSVPAPPGPPRVAYAIGRAAGNAVERNRLRRRLRAVVRAESASLRPGTAYLVSAGPRAAAMSHRDLARAVHGLLDGDAWS